MKIPPDKSCFLCRKSLNEVGGKRITGSLVRGCSLGQEARKAEKEAAEYLTKKISAEPVLFLSLWGEKEFCVEENLARAEQRFLAGFRIWFCQVCFQRTCKKCGEPTALPSGADIMNEYGEVTHVPAFVPSICRNPRCEAYRPPPDARMKSSE